MFLLLERFDHDLGAAVDVPGEAGSIDHAAGYRHLVEARVLKFQQELGGEIIISQIDGSDNTCDPVGSGRLKPSSNSIELSP